MADFVVNRCHTHIELRPVESLFGTRSVPLREFQSTRVAPSLIAKSTTGRIAFESSNKTVDGPAIVRSEVLTRVPNNITACA